MTHRNPFTTPLALLLSTLATFATSAPAGAVGTSTVGSGISLEETTLLHVDLVDDSERIEFDVRSVDGVDGELWVQSPWGDFFAFAVSDDTLVFDGQTGRWDFTFAPTGGQRLYEVDVRVMRDDVEQGGRLFSRQWNFEAGSYTNRTNAAFFIPVDDTALWRLEFNGLAGHEFIVAGSRLGVQAPFSGRSVPLQGMALQADHPVYLDMPEVETQATSTALLTDVVVDGDWVSWDLSRRATVVLQFASQDDVAYAADLSAGRHAWQMPADSVDSVDGVDTLVVAAREAEFHFVAMDVEFCRPGVRIHQWVDGGWAPSVMHWDDSLIDDGSLTMVTTPAGGISSGDVSSPARSGRNAHAWGGPLGVPDGPGNLTLIDTWTAANEESVRIELVAAPVADAGTAEAPAALDAGDDDTDDGGGLDAGSGEAENAIDAGLDDGDLDGGHPQGAVEDAGDPLVDASIPDSGAHIESVVVDGGGADAGVADDRHEDAGGDDEDWRDADEEDAGDAAATVPPWDVAWDDPEDGTSPSVTPPSSPPPSPPTDAAAQRPAEDDSGLSGGLWVDAVAEGCTSARSSSPALLAAFAIAFVGLRRRGRR